jgi:hypothetical protein
MAWMTCGSVARKTDGKDNKDEVSLACKTLKMN